jgi:hypothetical protein
MLLQLSPQTTHSMTCWNCPHRPRTAWHAGTVPADHAQHDMLELSPQTTHSMRHHKYFVKASWTSSCRSFKASQCLHLHVHGPYTDNTKQCQAAQCSATTHHINLNLLYLEAENYGPNQAKDQTWVTINNIFCTNTLQSNLQTSTDGITKLHGSPVVNCLTFIFPTINSVPDILISPCTSMWHACVHVCMRVCMYVNYSMLTETS